MYAVTSNSPAHAFGLVALPAGRAPVAPSLFLLTNLNPRHKHNEGFNAKNDGQGDHSTNHPRNGLGHASSRR